MDMALHLVIPTGFQGRGHSPNESMLSFTDAFTITVKVASYLTSLTRYYT